MNWEATHIEIDKVKAGEKHIMLFKAAGKVPEDFKIDKLEVSCGCTTPEFDKEQGTLLVTFKAGAVPRHLQEEGKYITTKRVILSSNYGDTTFTFRATIVK